MPVTFASRLTSRTPKPPLRSSEIGAAPSVSSSTSSSRSRSMAAPAAAASASAEVVVATTGSGAASCTGPGSSPRSTCPTWRGRITVSASMRRSSPIASSCGTGRSAGAPGAASRVRPSGDPSSSLSSSSRCGSSRPSISSAICSRALRGVFQGHLSRVPGQPGTGVGAARSSVSPQTRARSLRSSSGVEHVGFGRATVESARATWRSDTGSVSACRTSSASITASRRKSSSSLAALSDCRAWARAARAAMLPGGGWARSGLQLQQTDQPLVGQVGQPGPQRDARGVFGHC